MTSGTNLHSRYHPDYLPKGDPLRTSSKVLLCNGSPRAPLLRFSQGRLRNQIIPRLRTGSHQPPALWSAPKGQIFHPCLLYGICAIKPQEGPVVNGKCFTIFRFFQMLALDRKTFDFFSRTCYSICNIGKRL